MNRHDSCVSSGSKNRWPLLVSGHWSTTSRATAPLLHLGHEALGAMPGHARPCQAMPGQRAPGSFGWFLATEAIRASRRLLPAVIWWPMKESRPGYNVTLENTRIHGMNPMEFGVFPKKSDNPKTPSHAIEKYWIGAMSRFNLGYHLSSRKSLFGEVMAQSSLSFFFSCHHFGEQSITYLKHARLAQQSNPYHLTGQNESVCHELLSTSKSICRSGRVRLENSPSVFGAQTAASTFSVEVEFSWRPSMIVQYQIQEAPKGKVEFEHLATPAIFFGCGRELLLHLLLLHVKVIVVPWACPSTETMLGAFFPP